MTCVARSHSLGSGPLRKTVDVVVLKFEKNCFIIIIIMNNLTAIECEAINLVIPYIRSKNSTFPHWFSNSLKYYIKKKNQHFRRYKKLKFDHH
jgi:hypothetical protein